MPAHDPFRPRPAADPYAAAADTWQMLSGIIEASRMIPQALRAPAGSLPLTVIGGFLGAGKTTLLNALLTAPHGRRIAVLVNDFGRINIDAALVRSRTEDMISLNNGCACCSVAGDLTRTLIQLAQRSDPPEAIVLEASGLADPRGIAQVALSNPALRLDGLLVVADAETLQAHAANPLTRDAFLSQLGAADLVVLSKLDLLDAAGREAARAWLRDALPGRPCLEADQGRIPVELALGIASTRDVRSEAPVAATHAAGFASWSFECAQALDRGRLSALLESLPAGLLRAKGLLHLADEPAHCTVFQRVGQRWSLARGEAWAGSSDSNSNSNTNTNTNTITPASSLVLIGPEGLIAQDAFAARFAACRAG